MYKLALLVSGKNPGAMTIVKRLEYFSDYTKILKFLKKREITGEALWRYCKREHDLDVHKMVTEIRELRYKEENEQQEDYMEKREKAHGKVHIEWEMGETERTKETKRINESVRRAIKNE